MEEEKLTNYELELYTLAEDIKKTDSSLECIEKLSVFIDEKGDLTYNKQECVELAIKSLKGAPSTEEILWRAKSFFDYIDHGVI